MSYGKLLFNRMELLTEREGTLYLSLPKITSECEINELRRKRVKLLQAGPEVLAEFWRGTTRRIAP